MSCAQPQTDLPLEMLLHPHSGLGIICSDDIDLDNMLELLHVHCVCVFARRLIGYKSRVLAQDVDMERKACHEN